MTPERLGRIEAFIRAELAAIVHKEMRDPRAMLLSVTDVRARADLGMADVYVSSMAAATAAAQAELVRVLNRAAGFLRKRVAARQALRATPRLRFHYDDRVERGRDALALVDGEQAVSAADRPRSVAAGGAHEP